MSIGKDQRAALIRCRNSVSGRFSGARCRLVDRITPTSPTSMVFAQGGLLGHVARPLPSFQR